MTDPGLVLDTSAALAYTEGVFAVGERIADANTAGVAVVLPALCLAEAYRQVDAEGANLLDLLADLPQVVVTPVERDLCPFLGGWGRTLESMDLAHAALEAAARPVVPLMTTRREKLARVLAREWPIIDPYGKPE
jgi:hypothetical protein